MYTRVELYSYLNISSDIALNPLVSRLYYFDIGSIVLLFSKCPFNIRYNLLVLSVRKAIKAYYKIRISTKRAKWYWLFKGIKLRLMRGLRSYYQWLMGKKRGCLIGNERKIEGF